MNEQTIQAMLAITLLFVGLFFAIGDILYAVGVNREIVSSISRILSLLIFVFGIATAFALLIDALKTGK